MELHDLPLFPLNTVLFPGGALTLRIFEARYLDLVSECGHRGTGFGVCLILDGEEVGSPAIPAAWGCEARISDFSTGEDGLLLLSVRGERRFHVRNANVRDNGLLVARAAWIPETPAQSIRPEHQLLSVLLRRIVERAGAPHDQVEEPLFNDADWVGWRLAEWLPLSWLARQALLQESDAHARLQRLVELIADHQSS